MDKLKKLLLRISKRDRERLCDVIENLINGKIDSQHIQKLKGKNEFRVRVGRFRILFCIKGTQIEISAVKIRNEKTYK